MTLTFLTLFGLLAKPQLTRAGVELMRPEHAGRFERLLGDVSNAVSFTLIADGPAEAAVILVYQQAENYLIQPAVMRQAVELSGYATIDVVMLGGALLGVAARSSPSRWPPR